MLPPRVNCTKNCRRFLSLLLILALVLPSGVIFAPSTASAQEAPPETTTAPTPYPAPTWPEVAAQPAYTPSFDPAAEPATLLLDAPVVAADTEAVAVDTEANKSGVVVGAASATLTPAGDQVQLGALQVSVGSASGVVAQPITVQAEVLPPAEAQQWSPVGVAFRLGMASTDAGNIAPAALTLHQPLSLTVDYSQIPLRGGGSLADRLTLYRVTACPPERFQNEDGSTVATGAELATLQAECRHWEPLVGINDTLNHRLTVALTAVEAAASASEITPALDPTLTAKLYLPVVVGGVDQPVTEGLYVLAAAASGQQGNYTATPFASVNNYQVNLATGAMQTNYTVPLPPAAGGLAPAVALNYDSGSVDGRTSNKNNQPSWVGIGWDLQGGYIERHLKTCNLTQAPGDLCLTGDSYSIVFNGVSSRLVKISGNLYRLQNDPYWKVERFTNGGTTHPDTQKEYWLVTTPDGTKYRFGGEFLPTNEGGTDQNSVFFTPVYDSASCSAVSGNWVCDKAWRWNLDRVEDLNSNVIAYFYDQEINYYNARTFIRSDYVRAGNLNRIEYGRRKGSSTILPTRVMFVTENRCEGACVWPSTNYPDTPIDLECVSDTTKSCSQTAPTFWSKVRLNYIEPQYYNQTTSAWVNVARYDLDYAFPTPPNDAQGDTSERKLWLNNITQKLGDGTGGLPAAQYGYTMLANRWDHNVATVSPLYMPRINQIITQLGGVVSYTYGQSHPCQTAGNYIRLAYDCYPGWYVNGASYGWVLWNKWKVTQQTSSDTFSGNDSETISYLYSTPTWHYSDDPALPDINSCTLCPADHWNDFRGSEQVTVTLSSGIKSEYYFYRGMNNDRLTTTGGSFGASVKLSDSSTRLDENWWRGQQIEVRQLKSDKTPVTRVVNTYLATLNAGSGIGGAYFTGLQQSAATAYGTANKSTSTTYSYDSYGNVTRQVLAGDTATTADDRNIERSYVYSTTAWLVNTPQWEKVWAGTTSGTAGQEKGYTQYAYDNLAYGANPGKGNLTKAKNYWQATPSYQGVETTTAYDSYGRPTTMTDARSNATTTAYHSFYGYVTSVTNDLSHVTTYSNDPGWGMQIKLTDPNNKITEVQYDGYGRLQKVWLPSESKATDPASLEFVYDAAARPANVKSRTLQVKASSTYLDGWQYVDGFGRELQSQTPAATSGQRIVASKRYNNLGQLRQVSAPYQLSGAAGSGYSAPTWNTVTSYHQYSYNELGNVWLDETMNNSTVLWSTTTIHDAWQKRVYNPNGKRSDYDQNAFGQLAKVTEYNVGSVAYNTVYSYDLLGNLTGVTDHLSNVTTMGYDLLGRKTSMTDPDMGSWVYQYDAVGNLTGQRDARNLWLYLAYDDLNRPLTKRKDNATTGALIVDYSYDATGQKGLLTKSRAYNAAGTTVEAEAQSTTYDNRNRLTQQNWVVNGVGTFRLDSAFNEADQKTSFTYPGGSAAQQGEVVSYQYNPVGQLAVVSGVGGIQYVSSATYNAQGQLTDLRNDSGVNGLTRKWTYESNTLRLSTMQAGNNVTFDNLQKLTYAYDNSGNVTSLVDTANSSQKQCFQYDWLDRLTGAFTGDAGCTAYSATGTGPYNHSYTYNEVGNITSYAGNAYTYGDAAHKHAVTAAFGNSYGYDANGNQTTRTIAGVTYNFTFDYENRITAISGGSVSATFVYDASGQRVKGTVGGVTTIYIAGVYEYQAGATTLYYEGNALRRTGYATDNGVFYNLRDHLGSSSVLSNQNGTVNGSRNYFFPFGGNRGGVAFNGVTTKRFTGQYHEVGLPGGEGLSYYGARWYDAKLGRFLSADTVVPGPANPQAFNRYSYVKNSPTGRIDPTGHYDIKPGDAPYSNKPKPSSASGGSGNSSGSAGSWLTPVSDFFYGGFSQWGYNNSWASPAYQTRFAEQPYESTATTVGRHAANLVSMVQGGIELIGGGGLGLGGAAACGTGVLCVAGAPAIAGGAALVAHGGTTAAAGALEEGRMLANWMFSKRTVHGEDRHSQQNRPTGQAWNDAQNAGSSDVFVDTDTGYYGVQGPKERIHLFAQSGDQVRHHTSFWNPAKNTRGRLINGPWRTLTMAEYDQWEIWLNTTLQGR